jgi:HK97 family phage portal protein
VANIVQRALQKMLGVEERGRIENPAVPLSSANVLSALGEEQNTPAGVSISNHKALGITAFWAGVRIISQTVAGLPVGAYERVGEDRRPARDHPAHRLLHVRPNPYMTPYTFKEMRASHVITWGNSYCEIERDRVGRPLALWPLLPDRTGAEMVDGEKIYWTHVNGEKKYLAADRVLHVPGLGFDGIRGYNVVHMHRNSLGLTMAADEYGARFFGNSGRPSGILTHPGKPEPAERQQFREEWNQVHSGLNNAQRTAVMWGGMDWKAISVPPEDAQFLETRAMQIEEVARILNLNPILLQHFQKATTWGTGIGQFLTGFAKFTIAPWLVRDEDAFNYDLFSEAERGRYYVKYNLNALMRGDAKEQAEVLEIERRNGIINADDWLELKDENPLPNGQGKTYFVPLNWVPLDQAGKEPEPAPAPPPPTPEPEPEANAARTTRSLPPKNSREQRSLKMRARLREAHLSAFEDGARRFVRRDILGIQQAVKRAFESGGDPVAALTRWIEEFYPGQERTILQTMLPLVSALASSVAAEAAEEVGAEPEDIAAFAQSYTETLAIREAGSSRGQLLAIIQDESPDALQDALTTRVSEWSQTRAIKIAENEVVRVSSGAARFAYAAAGVSFLVWRANAGACPICQEMDGRRSAVRGSFLSPGDTVNSGEGTAPLTAEQNITSPPLHQGCSCEISPE